MLCQYPFFVCPVEYSEAEDSFKYDCDPSPIFRPQEYSLPETMANFSALVCKEIIFYSSLKEVFRPDKARFNFIATN